MGMTHPAIVDDSGSRTDGTVWNNAWEALHDAAIDVAIGTVGSTVPTTTGTITAEPIPTGTGELTTYHNNATLKTIQGMVAGTHGQIWTHYSKGAGQVDFAHLHASGTALGKLKLFATTGFTSLAAGVGVAVFQYDATVGVTQWRLVTHEQGAWITPTFATGDYTAATGNWVLVAGDVGLCRYLLHGRTLEIDLILATTEVSATPATLIRLIPGGFTTAHNSTQLTRVSNNGAAFAVGLVTVSSTQLVFYATVGAGAWATSAAPGSTSIEGKWTVELN